MDSEEYDRWGMEIASGDWLGKEVFFQAPLYPYFLGAVYAVFGHHLDIVYLFQILLGVFGCWALYRAGLAAGDRTLGLAAAGLAAVYGVFLFYDVQILKTSPAAAASCFLLWMLMEARRSDRARYWLWAGVISGILSLLRENMLLVFPFLFLLAWDRKKGWKPALANCGYLTLGLVLVLIPVAARNGLVGGVFLPTTFQGGVNFYIGNNPQADGTYRPIVPGKQTPVYERKEPVRIAEQETGRSLNPAEASRFWLQKSLSWIQKEPGAFLELMEKKFRMFWSWYEWPDAVDYYYVTRRSSVFGLPLPGFGSIFLLFLFGLVLGRRRLNVFLPCIVFAAAWSAATVVFFIFSRYRLPAVPALMIPAAVPISVLAGFIRKKELRKAAAAGVCVLGVFFLPMLKGYAPRMDLVHYNLGLAAEKEGLIDKAAEHYKKALAVNPNDFLSCTNLGNIAAEREEWASALRWYKKALKLEPRSEGVHLNLGIVHIQIGRFAEAEIYLKNALRINPKNSITLHNISVLMAAKGDLGKAELFNREALKHNPDYEPALRFKEKIRRMTPEKQ